MSNVAMNVELLRKHLHCETRFVGDAYSVCSLV